MQALKEEVELQPRITLDDALLQGMETYHNGCSFSLLVKSDGTYWLTFGCYLLVNLAQGHKRLLMNWLGGADAKDPEKQLDGYCRPETLIELLKRPQCKCCGGYVFQKRDSANG